MKQVLLIPIKGLESFRNTVRPVVTGTNKVGETLTSTSGTWVSDESISYSYQWYRDGILIVGATSNTYLLTEADEDSDIYCRVTALSDSVSKSKISNVIRSIEARNNLFSNIFTDIFQPTDLGFNPLFEIDEVTI
jgi:hypothetical protein